MLNSKASTALLRLKEIDQKYRTKYETVEKNKISDISSESSLDSSGNSFKRDSRATVPTFFPGKPKIESIGKQEKDASPPENNSTTKSSSLFIQRDRMDPKFSGIPATRIFGNQNLLKESMGERNSQRESIKSKSDSVSIKEDDFEISRNSQPHFLIQQTSNRESENIEEADETSIGEEISSPSTNSIETESSSNESRKDPSEISENQELSDLHPLNEDEKYEEDSFEEISSSEEESEVENEENREILKTIASTREELGELLKVDAEKHEEIDENVGDALSKTSNSQSSGNSLENDSFGVKEVSLREREKDTKEILSESYDEDKPETEESGTSVKTDFSESNDVKERNLAEVKDDTKQIISQLSDKASINKSRASESSSKDVSLELKKITPRKLEKSMRVVSLKSSEKDFNKDQSESLIKFSDTRLEEKEGKDFSNSFPKCPSPRRSKSGKESCDSINGSLTRKAKEMTLIGTLENINRSPEAAKSKENSASEGNKTKDGKSQFSKEHVVERGRNVEKEGKDKDDTEVESSRTSSNSSLNEINSVATNTGKSRQKTGNERHKNKMLGEIRNVTEKSWKEKSMKNEASEGMKNKERVKKTEVEFSCECECSNNGRRSCKKRRIKRESSIKINSHPRDQIRSFRCQKKRERILAMIEYRLNELGRHRASIPIRSDCYIKALEFPKILGLSSDLVDFELEDHPIILRHRLIQIQQWLKSQLILYQKYSDIALDLNNSYIPITLDSTKKMIKEIRIAADLCKATRKVRTEK